MNLQKTGVFIQNARKRLNLSQRMLGEKLSVTSQAVSKWERGLGCPDIEVLKEMALLFGCSMTDILNGEMSLTTAHCFLQPNGQSGEVAQDDIEGAPERDIDISIDLSSAQLISPLLFGDNLEHTRACIYGGLSAELLKNRKFTGISGRYGCAQEWYPIGRKTLLSLETDVGFLPAGKPYTRHAEGHKMHRSLERNAQYITNFADEKGGIGQKNLYVRGAAIYDCTVAVMATVTTKLTVSLLAADRTVYDSKTITVPVEDYEEITVSLASRKEDPEARLEITFDTEGTVMIGAVSLLPSDHFHGLRRDVIERMKELGIRLLRWPGGNFAGDYYWKDGLLPRNMRAPFGSHLGLGTQPNSMGFDFHEIGTDDFIALCREIGAEPFITINLAWNTPEESAEWVEYCNGDSTTKYGRLRAERGYPEPYGVQFWSLGNEAGYGHMEGANTPEGYAKAAREHAQKMLAVSPGLTFCSSGPYPDQGWVDNCAKKITDVSNAVSFHHYTAFPTFRDPKEREREYATFVRDADVESFGGIRDLSKMLEGTGIKISYDEWNAWNAWFRTGSVSEGIYAAAFLNMLFRHADKCGVMMACHFESVNEGAIMVYPDRVELAPAGVVFSLMKEHAGGIVCALEQDVTATRKDSIVTCTLLNRAYAKDKRFMLRDCGEILSAALYRSEDVVPTSVFEETELFVEASDGSIETTLPPHSIAQIRMRIEQ